MFPGIFVVTGFDLIRSRGVRVMLFGILYGVAGFRRVALLEFDGGQFQRNALILGEQNPTTVEYLQSAVQLAPLGHLGCDTFVNGGDHRLGSAWLVLLLTL